MQNNFKNATQSMLYKIARPSYTNEIFSKLTSLTKEKNLYMDLACGTGQLLFPISCNFKKSYGFDVSETQLKYVKEIISKEQNIEVDLLDGYNLEKYVKSNITFNKTSKVFDLITVGQAFHWFEASKILDILRNCIDEDGVISLLGYKKQHFKKEDPLFEIFENMIQKLKPYFECDVDYNDNAYDTYEFKNKFSKVERFYFEEDLEVPVDVVINMIKSASAYYNYLKKHPDDCGKLIEKFENDIAVFLKIDKKEFSNKIIKYRNFYFMINLSK